ncbi:glycosyltransferase family 2 protein [Pseudothauera rhizosphaerae]|uniref:glycosyltransferase family 2 protein n=1 Tax=Pseudothauera rhizosphaerae TaxID=2565932 RepID=UPI001454B98F|nr:glycosyltransferase family 2 protein [Pseudothauera rhizosphaerae]
MFAVIIPYFQRQPGILARTLESVALQDVAEPVHVYVVDDESPAPPEPEVAQVSWPAHFSVRILKKRNGGPGSARNLGLDHLGEERYVAFVDSDDCWAPYHLSAARYAFDHGYDFYTADWCIDDKGTRAHGHFYGDALKTRAIAGVDWAVELDDDLINYTVYGPIGSTCSMVLTRELVSGIRFAGGLRTAGEDGLFATTIAARRPRVFISRRIDTHLGRGVNIFSSGGWNSRQSLMRSIYFLRSRLLMKPLVSGHPVAAERLQKKIAGARRAVWRGLLSTLKRRELPPRELLSLLAADPPLLLGAPAHIRAILRSRAEGGH